MAQDPYAEFFKDSSAKTKLPPGSSTAQDSASDDPYAEFQTNRAAAPEATIQADNRSGFRRWVDEAENDLRYGGTSTAVGKVAHALGMPGINRGVNENTADLVGGVVVAPLTAAQAGDELVHGHGVRALNKGVEALGEAALPVSVAVPEALPLVSSRFGGAVVGSKLGSAAAEKLNITDPDYKELASNAGGVLGAGAPDAPEAAKATIRGAGKTYNVTRAAAQKAAPYVKPFAPVLGAVEGYLHGGLPGATYGAISGGTLGRALGEFGKLPEAPESITKFGLPKEPTLVEASPAPAGAPAPAEAAPVTAPANEPLVSTAPKKVSPLGQVDRIGELLNDSLGGKPLEPKTPLRSQPALREALQRLSGKSAADVDKLSDAEVREQLQSKHLGQFSRTNGTQLDDSIPDSDAGNVLRAKLHSLSNVELRQLAINLGEDLGQSRVSRAKSDAGAVTREDVFNRLLKNYSPDQIGDSVDQGWHKGPKTVSGGSASAQVVPQYVYRVRDVGEKGLPFTGSHAQATASPFEARGYVEGREAFGNKPQEVVRIDLSKVDPSMFETKKGPNGYDWYKFKSALPEDVFSPLVQLPPKSSPLGRVGAITEEAPKMNPNSERVLKAIGLDQDTVTGIRQLAKEIGDHKALGRVLRTPLDKLKETFAPAATMETARLPEAELLKRGFTQEDIDAGKHLPTVSGSYDREAWEDAYKSDRMNSQYPRPSEAVRDNKPAEYTTSPEDIEAAKRELELKSARPRSFKPSEANSEPLVPTEEQRLTRRLGQLMEQERKEKLQALNDKYDAAKRAKITSIEDLDAKIQKLKDEIRSKDSEPDSKEKQEDIDRKGKELKQLFELRHVDLRDLTTDEMRSLVNTVEREDDVKKQGLLENGTLQRIATKVLQDALSKKSIPDSIPSEDFLIPFGEFSAFDEVGQALKSMGVTEQDIADSIEERKGELKDAEKALAKAQEFANLPESQYRSAPKAAVRAAKKAVADLKQQLRELQKKQPKK